MPKKTVKALKAVRSAQAKPIGVVTHFYGNIKVAIIKFKKSTKVGTEIIIRGSSKDVKQKIASMQFDHKPIKLAPKGKEVGIKVSKKVHEGDLVFANNAN